MTARRLEADDERARALAAAALRRPRCPYHRLPGRLILVDVARQALYLLVDGGVAASYRVSTAAAGIGGEAGSLRTPPGWHRVAARIGGGEPAGRVFESRSPTARLWRGEPETADLIVGRVLTLEGLEDGVNRGGDRDSRARYIYIHGTNHEGALGRPASHGCVRMGGADVVDLHDRVTAGDPVAIVTEEELARA